MVYKIAEAMLALGAMPIQKLQKLCYFSYSWYLTFFGEKLFSQKFIATEEGPVCPELDARYGIYANEYIPRIDKDMKELVSDVELQEFLLAVYDAHGFLTLEELTELACSEEPWYLSRSRVLEGEGCAEYVDDEIVNWNTKKVLNELSKENSCLI